MMAERPDETPAMWPEPVIVPGSTQISLPAYSDAYPAPPLHDGGCIDWCNHCALCGGGALYGARCRDHHGVYPAHTNRGEQSTRTGGV